MKVILAFVASADGRVTGPRNEPSREWASPEDQKFFAELVQKTGVVIMGRSTFLLHKKFFSKSPHIRRIVMTSDTKLAATKVPGIEFSTEKPTRLIRRLEREGVNKVLLAGGPRLSAAFMHAKLVSDFFLTIEPKIFGGGLPLFDGLVGKPRFALTATKRLNSGGTILLHYRIEY